MGEPEGNAAVNTQEQDMEIDKTNTIREEPQGQVGDDTVNSNIGSVPIITPTCCSRRLEQKRDNPEYQMGQATMSATKRKAVLVDPDPGMSTDNIDVLSIISDDVLLSITHACDIDIGKREVVQGKNLRVTKEL